jgi:hypothetical protein
MQPDIPLLMIVERFLRETQMPATLFGRRAVKDPSFVSDLRRGRSVGTAVRCRVEHFMNITRASGQREAA